VVVRQLLTSALILAAVPVALDVVSRILRAHYRRVMWKSRNVGPPDLPQAETEEAAVPLISASDVSASDHPARDEAAAATRDMRIAHVIAGLVYGTSVVAMVLLFVRLPSASRLSLAYASLAPSLLLVLWTLRLPRRQKTWVFLIYAIAAAALVLVTSNDPLHILTWTRVAVLLIIPALVVLTDRVIEPFVILLLPVLFVIFGLGIVVDLIEPGMIEKGEEVLKGLIWWILLSGIASAIGGFYLVRALLRKGWVVRVIVCVLAVIAVLVLNPTHDRKVSSGIGIAGISGAVVLQWLVIGALFQFFAWLQHRHVLTNELLHIHLAWAWLTLYFELWAFLQPTWLALRWWFLSAFAISTAALHVLLFLLRRRLRPTAPKRMLLLRAFGGPDERQDLLDDLRDTWRRVGAIDIIVATDVATRMLRPDMLAAYVLRRTGEQFLGSEAAADKWLKEHRSAIEGDARYPENPAFCSDDAWRRAFLPLARGADVVLMDVRDFDMTHEGCVFELKTLRDEKRLPRVLFIANERTDRKAIAGLLRGHEIKMLDFGHRTDDERRALFDLLLTAAYA
jgi:hypothetical protein